MTPTAVPRLAFAELPINAITVRSDRRRLRNVEALAESIARLGLLNPITVVPTGDCYRLVAGLHRLEACRRLGWTTIPATVATMGELAAELAQIDENLVRNDLTVLERAEHLARRKAIYEKLHPETRHGGAPGRKGGGKKAKDAPHASFAADTSAKAGIAPRTVQEDVQLATRPAPDVRDAVRATPIADEKKMLLKLAGLSPARQRTALAKAKSEDGTFDASGLRRAVRAETQDRLRERISRIPANLLPPPTGGRAIRMLRNEKDRVWRVVIGPNDAGVALRDRIAAGR